MTRLEALTTLKEAVEAGDVDDFGGIKPGDALIRGYADSAFNGSIDAAKALHDKMLPGWPWSIKTLATDAVQAWTNHAYGLRTMGHIGTTKDNPARAWLLAILSALIAMETDRDRTE